MRSLLLAAALLIAACSRPEPPTLQPERATVTAVTPAGIDLRVEISAYNPNAIDITARSVKANVKLDKKIDVGTVTSQIALRLPAKQKTRLDVPLSVQWSDLGAMALLAAGQKAVPYQVEGTIALGGDRINIDVPFRLEGTIPHEQLVQAVGRSLPKIPGLQ